MVEVLIRTWRRFNGTWEVTLHKGINNYDGYLHDVAKYYKRGFKTREEAEKYAKKLFDKFTKKGNEVRLNSPDDFAGQGLKDGGWQSFSGHKFRKISKNGKVIIDTWKLSGVNNK